MEEQSAEELPVWLAKYRVLGTAAQHSCLELDSRVVGYWLVGQFRRTDLDHLTRFSWDACARTHYVSVAFTERLTGYDSDLRTVMTEPGELRIRRAVESIVVTANPLERMIVNTMSLAGRAVGNPGGALSAASSLDEALGRAREVLAKVPG